MTLKIVLVSLLSALFGVTIYPFESTIVPEWRVKIADLNGAVFKDMPVNEMEAGLAESIWTLKDIISIQI